MINFIQIATPLAVIFLSLILIVLLFKRRGWSLLHRSMFYSLPVVILLQVGTYALFATDVPLILIVAGKLIVGALCILTPLSARIALLWGTTNDRDVLHKFRFITRIQWIASLIFCVLLAKSNFIYLVSDPGLKQGSVAFGEYGQLFLIYLMVSCVLNLSLFEKKLRIFRNDSELRIPTMIFLAIFGFFVIAASQGLLINTLNKNVFLMISGCILLGYIAPVVFRIRINIEQTPSRRTSVYSSVMLLIIGSYLVLVGLFSKVLFQLGGDLYVFFTGIAGIATIVLFFFLLGSVSVKTRIRRFVDRTIYGSRFDYRTIWHRFSEATSFNIKPDELTESILDMVLDIVSAIGGVILLTKPGSSQLYIAKKKPKLSWEIFHFRRNRILLIGFGDMASLFRLMAQRLQGFFPTPIMNLKVN